MKHFRKLLAVILTLTILLSCVPFAQAADIVKSGSCGYNVSYTLDSDGVFTITGTGSMNGYTILNGVNTAPWDAYKDSLKTVIIESGVTTIGSYAFRGCSSLTSVEISDSVTTIGNGAFSGCSSLKGVYISDLESWLNIDFSDSDSNPLYYAHNLYINGELATEIVIPDSVSSIKKYAFCGCSSLTSVEIPDSVTTIGSYAFYDCSSLYSIIIKSDEVVFGTIAFHNANGIKDIYFSGSQAQWESKEKRPSASRIFYDIDTEYSLSDGVLFNKNGTLLVDYPNAKTDRYYVVPDGVRSVGTRAFDACKNLYTVILPEGVKSIGSSSFYNAYLRSVYIPSSIVSIEENAFRYNSCLTDIYFGGDEAQWSAITKDGSAIPTDVTIHYNEKLIVENGCVYNSDKTELVLFAGDEEEFVLPSFVTSINESAFYNSNVRKVTLNDNITKINSYTFQNCRKLEEIVLPESLLSIGSYAFENCTSLKNVSFPERLDSIGSYAFRYCNRLEAAVFENGTETIGDYAFYQCTSLKDVILPQSLLSLGQYSFSGCTSLSSIDIPDSVETMGTYAFNGCVSIETAKLSAGVKVLPTYTFNGCNSLKTLIVPETVTSFGDSSFTGCSILEDVYFGGSNVQWDNVKINNGNNVIYAANIHYAHVHEFGEWVVVTPVTEYKDGLEERVCQTCGYTERVVIACGHEHNYVSELLTPDGCYEMIIKRFTCVCGKNYDVEMGLKGHTIQYVASKKSTCIENGNISHYYCAVCDKHFSNSGATKELVNESWLLPYSDHSWKYDHTVSDACDEPGTAYYYCAVCGEEKTEQVIVGHSFTETVSEPTCLSRGYIKHDCNKCDYTFTDAYTPALGHMDINKDRFCDVCGEVVGGGCSHEFEISFTNATCTTDGRITMTCTICDKKSTETISSTGHNYVDFVVEPTCTSQGYTKHYCINCGDEYHNAFVKVMGHAMRTMTITPTCTDNGCDIEICDNCGYNYEDNVVTAVGHAMSLKLSVPPTCQHGGETVYECEVCHATETETSPAKEHTVITDSGFEATCTEAGISDGSHCSDCGEVFLAQEVIPAKGHTEEFRGSKEATKTEPGFTGDVYCSDCGEKLRDGAVIPAGSSLKPEEYPNFADGAFRHRNNGNNWDFWYENDRFVNGTEFVVGEVTEGTDFESCNDKHHKFKMYDLKAQVGEMAVQPGGDIWVALPLPGNYDETKTVIYYVNGDTFESIPCFIKDGKIYFRTNHFSSYAIVDLSEEGNIPGDANGDGIVNTADRMILARSVAKWAGYSEQIADTRSVDLNGDGQINTADRMVLSRYLAKWAGYDAYLK